MKKTIPTKTLVLSVVIILVLAILYFLFFVVDIVTYIKNYDYLQQAGKNATELHKEIQESKNETNTHYEEYKETKRELESILNKSN